MVHLKQINFQIQFTQYLKDQIENAKGGKVNVDQLMSQAASLGRSDVYLTILNKKQGQALPLDVGVRAIMETKLLYLLS